MKVIEFNNKLVSEKLKLLKNLPNNPVLIQEVKDRIIVECLPLVHKIVICKYKKFPDCIEFDELVSTGTLGLIDAVNKYDPDNIASFKTYAWFRITGTISDDLRYWDDVSRHTRANNTKISQVRTLLEQGLARSPTDGEMATHMGMKLDKFQELEFNSQVKSTISFEDPNPKGVDLLLSALVDRSEYARPEDNCDFVLVGDILRCAIRELRPKEADVMQWHYFENKTIDEIATRLEVTPARVSQLKIKAELSLKRRLRDLII